ncbi:glycosyltransferase involved in cell wall biosynthesis [Saccharothrix tamanrassetensis]|uniref:Glycosyltransferase involved in cell wall biosynthesis n=1 Tax=Saccharothrix tamanrassetensis TaxID=1051531 RepID=A0A841CHH6_9PSEU|nr:glycosyltransferase family 1 protein [Saccharothrix tamanrassetensis]MBB5955146.1 glycosyltransferase involved in cell wall biosynthesis [Saccharothrix tamanrassetensis]
MPNLVVLTEQLLAPVPGGTGRYTRELTAALAATAPAGWEVTGVVSRQSDVSAAAVPGVSGPRVLPLPRRALIAAWEHGIPYWPGGDAVHAPTPLAPPRGRVVVTVHDVVPWTHPETLTSRGALWHRKVITRAVSRAAAIVVPTHAVADELRRYAPGPVPVKVVHNGVTEFPAEEPVPDLPARYVLAVGTIEPRKGFGELVAATAEVDVPLVVVGPQGWGGVDLRAPHVRLLGRLSDPRLAHVLRRAAVLAAPSLAEGFGLPVVEAMAAGVPVIHSDAPALVEVAAGAGLVVPRGNRAALVAALRSVLSDTAVAQRVVASGLTRAQHFTWENAAREVWSTHLSLGRRHPV